MNSRGQNSNHRSTISSFSESIEGRDAHFKPVGFGNVKFRKLRPIELSFRSLRGKHNIQLQNIAVQEKKTRQNKKRQRRERTSRKSTMQTTDRRRLGVYSRTCPESCDFTTVGHYRKDKMTTASKGKSAPRRLQLSEAAKVKTKRAEYRKRVRKKTRDAHFKPDGLGNVRPSSVVRPIELNFRSLHKKTFCIVNDIALQKTRQGKIRRKKKGSHVNAVNDSNDRVPVLGSALLDMSRLLQAAHARVSVARHLRYPSKDERKHSRQRRGKREAGDRCDLIVVQQQSPARHSRGSMQADLA
jgi:hypothetical protein